MYISRHVDDYKRPHIGLYNTTVAYSYGHSKSISISKLIDVCGIAAKNEGCKVRRRAGSSNLKSSRS